MISLDQVTPASFSAHVGSAFQVRVSGSETVDAELISVTPFATAAKGPRSEPFSLLFCVRSAKLPQQVYHLAHAVMGELEVFLVPVGLDERGLRMEAVFN